MFIPEILLFKGVQTEDKVITVYPIDLPVHTCTQVNRLIMKKNHLNSSSI